MTRGELLDWLAVYQQFPWGAEREDLRSAAQAIWIRSGFDKLKIDYPYIDETSEEDDLEAIAEIEEAKRKHAAT